MRKISVLLLACAAQTASADLVDDPWAAVPELPTACYTEQDNFPARAASATETLDADRSRQDEINQSISQQFNDMDIMQQQERMMAFLMEHPQDAQKYMESLMQTGQEVSEQSPEMFERYAQLDGELQSITEGYIAAKGALDTSFQERGRRLEEGAGQCNEAWLEQARTFLAEQNSAYETLCATWWLDGPFHAWLGSFKQFEIETATSQDEQDTAASASYAILEIESETFRPTGSMKAAIEYLRRAGQIFAHRENGPISQDIQCEGV